MSSIYAADNMLTFSGGIGIMSASADLRITSKRAYYDNGKPYGESETITLYIYNAGPDPAVAPTVKAGYSWSMDWTAVTTTLREAEVPAGRQPSKDIRAGSLIWRNLTSPTTHFVSWDMVTTLPDLRAGVLMELSLSFPMTQTSASNRDYTATASVASSVTTDPLEKNNSTTYLITPNHRSDGPAYWNTPGDLKNLGFIGLTGVETLSQADLRIASVRAYYNNNLGYGKSETLSFYVFNDGPTIAVKPVLTAGYTTSMDWTKITCSAEQVWVPEGINPSYLHDNVKWQPLQDVSCRYVQWDAICDLPNIPPSTLYRVNISFPMNSTASSQDYTATASIASEAKELNPADNSTTYVITPNHGTNNTDEYWKTKGEITQLDGSSVPSVREGCSTGWLLDTPIIVTDLSKGNRRQIRLAELEGLIKTTTLQSYDTQKNTLESMRAIGVGYKTSSKACVVTFSADGKNGLTYTALPDTLVYVLPFTRRVGEDDVRLGYWIPVRMLWVGARIRGMGPDGGLTTTYVLDVQQVERAGQVYQSAEPRMLGMSHSYVIGTLKGGVLTHNPKDSDPYGSANVSAILQAFSIIANNLIAIATPTAPHGYSLRYRCPTDPPAPAPAPGMPFVPIIPADIPRRGKDGIWLIYLYEESMPAAVENARAAVEGGRHPAILTYDPAGVVARRQQSTGRSQAQRELLQLNTVESLGQVGTLGRLDRDEYPPAIAREAGNGALVTYVEAGNNRRVGSLMGQQFGASGIQPGDRFRYVIIHKNMANVKYLDENSEDEAQIDLLSIN
jgi:hypothetical protein